jgi:hypothetical protein
MASAHDKGTAMRSILYNDLKFAIGPSGDRWTITRKSADGSSAVVAAGLFCGVREDEALARAEALVRILSPVGIRLVGPDVSHPNRVGDLKIVGPDVTHPNFIHWEGDSTSFPRSN